MNPARSTSAPNTPQNKTRNWYCGRHDEERQDHGPHEHVVDAQAELEQVAGPVLPCRLPAVPREDEQPEGQADRHPHTRLDRRLAHRDDVRLPVQHEQVGQQQRRHESEEGEPFERRDLEARERVVVGGSRGGGRNREVRWHDQLLSSTACAAASRAIGTRNGEHET